jgi:hypothetical protein
MADREDQSTIENPHHVLNFCESNAVKRIQVKSVTGQILQEFEPIASRDEIERYVRKTYGVGKYSLVGISSHTGKQLPGYQMLEVASVQSLGGSFSSVREAMDLPDTKHQEELSIIQTQQARLHELQDRIEKDRESLSSEWKRLQDERKEVDKANAERADMERRTTFAEKDRAQNDYIKMFTAFVAAEKDSERKTREKELELQRENEKRKVDFENKVYIERQAIEAERVKFQQQMIQSQREETDRRIAEERRRHEAELLMMKEQFNQQLAMQKQMMDFKIEQQEADLREKLQPALHDHIPDFALEEIWKRKIDKDYPEEGQIERLFKQIAPLVEVLQAQGVFKRISGVVPQQRPVPALSSDDVEPELEHDVEVSDEEPIEQPLPSIKGTATPGGVVLDSDEYEK